MRRFCVNQHHNHLDVNFYFGWILVLTVLLTTNDQYLSNNFFFWLWPLSVFHGIWIVLTLYDVPSLKFFAFPQIHHVYWNLRLRSNSKSSPSYVANSKCEKNDMHPAHVQHYQLINQLLNCICIIVCHTIYLMIRSTYDPIESILLPFQRWRKYRLFWVSAIVYALIDRYDEYFSHPRVFRPSRFENASKDVLVVRCTEFA